MSLTRAQAVANAKASTAYPVGMCMKWTRTMFGRPAVGDVDGDGDADAVDGWKSCKQKHPGDRNPPAGVPVFWSGGRNGYGHVGISLGNRTFRGTDSPTSGKVGTVGLDWPEQHWGLTYLGWADDLNGVPIPGEPEQPAAPAQTKRYGAIKAAVEALKVARKTAIRQGDTNDRKRIGKAILGLRKDYRDLRRR